MEVDFSRYRLITPKARLVPLTQPFLDYLRSDGIVLPNDDNEPDWSDNDSGTFSGNDNADEAEEDEPDVSLPWQEVHQAIGATIAELGGKVVPKLNWSAPKDATWISATNSMECRSPNDVYLLLKSSDFVTHDLEHAFDNCVDDGYASKDHEAKRKEMQEIPYFLVLRKWIQLNPSVEFRCFVRRGELIAMCQRDLNHFEFLFAMQDKLGQSIRNFFEKKLKHTFPDDSFVFDVYIPPPHERIWLIDINPWAERTDPLLFSWLELLTKSGHDDITNLGELTIDDSPSAEAADESEDAEEEIFRPEFRLIRSDDPEAYGFTTPQYSAHKLPKDVVDASSGGEMNLKEFAHQWKEVLEKRQAEEEDDSEAD